MNNIVEHAYQIPNAVPEVTSHCCIGVLWTIPVQLQFTYVVLAATVVIRDIRNPWKRTGIYTAVILAGWYAKVSSATFQVPAIKCLLFSELVCLPLGRSRSQRLRSDLSMEKAPANTPSRPLRHHNRSLSLCPGSHSLWSFQPDILSDHSRKQHPPITFHRRTHIINQIRLPQLSRAHTSHPPLLHRSANHSRTLNLGPSLPLPENFRPPEPADLLHLPHARLRHVDMGSLGCGTLQRCRIALLGKFARHFHDDVFLDFRSGMDSHANVRVSDAGFDAEHRSLDEGGAEAEETYDRAVFERSGSESRWRWRGARACVSRHSTDVVRGCRSGASNDVIRRLRGNVFLEVGAVFMRTKYTRIPGTQV